MVRYTNKHFRFLIRLMSKHVFLYTPMITTNTLLYGPLEKILAFDAREHPLAIQLGGCDPKSFVAVIPFIQSYGYDEINLNIGCPSKSAEAGQFGASLIENPSLVAECVSAIHENTKIPITIKTRLGLGRNYAYDLLLSFVKQTSRAGCNSFIIHARSAWCDGLNPAQNRFLPPLCYEEVYRLKHDFPALEIIINGGIKSTEEISNHLNFVDGVMLGRKAYSDPYFFSAIDSLFFNDTKEKYTRDEVLARYLLYIKNECAKNKDLSKTLLLTPALNLFHKCENAKAIRAKICAIM